MLIQEDVLLHIRLDVIGFEVLFCQHMDIALEISSHTHIQILSLENANPLIMRDGPTARIKIQQLWSKSRPLLLTQTFG